MRPLTSICLKGVAALALAGTMAWAQAAGYQHGHADDPQGPALEISIWYPSATPAGSLDLGPYTLKVAPDAPLQGRGLPLVVVSHGNGGSMMGHQDTAIALADAGFVVAAVTHTGDNYADQSRALDILDRPRQISRVIDHMLSRWPGHEAIDPARVGVFGFSSGGFTALVDIGGRPDLSLIAGVCREHPEDYACGLIARSRQPVALPAVPVSLHDERIRAAVVAAPALGFTFTAEGLKDVKVPVQLWRAEDDRLLPQPRYAEAVRLALPQAPEYHVVPLAGHFDFLAPCSALLAQHVPDICRSNPGFDRAAFHERFDAEVVGFFERTLKAAD
ncbi:MAG: dienelactone hydrolase [Curvibacter sp.]|nr:dienelactone hydrolase [Curvibacter sp.]